MALWNGDTVKDVSESVGISSLSDEVAKNLAMDVEYRMHQVLQEALKFMRHSKRTVLGTADISNALRVLDVEPLYGYESARPLRYGEASLGQAQPIYYVEDDEVDFEKLINAPLPKVPREVTFTAHWLAIEGVQPSIPQNPTQSESARLSETTPKGASSASTSDTAIKPLVKHILSKELQLYFDRICSALTEDPSPTPPNTSTSTSTSNTPPNTSSTPTTSTTLRTAALSSLRNDPGLHQLLPYFVQFISEKVTHSLKQTPVLTTMLELTHALLENPNLFIEPYVSSLIPPILTCLIGKRLGDPASSTYTPTHIALRDFAASLLRLVCKRFGDSSHTLKPRLTRTCLKHFLDPAKPAGTHYGAIIGLAAIGGREAVRVLVLPNVTLFVESVVRGGLERGGAEKGEAEVCLGAVVGVLKLLEEEGAGGEAGMGEEVRGHLVERVGELVAEELWKLGRAGLVRAVLEPQAGMRVAS